MQSTAESLHDTEGLVVGLYYHLWRKTHKQEPCPGVNIPHTVIYQDSSPIGWYFTSSKDHKLYRKKKSNIAGQAIFDALASHKHDTVDACAWFSGTMSHALNAPKGKKTVDPMYQLEPVTDDKEATRFDYFPRERLQSLVAPSQYTHVSDSIYDGVLQKFVMPRESTDHVIRAIWSPTACVCERRSSTLSLSDNERPLSDRMASFEGDTFWLSTHQTLPLGSVLVSRIIATCEHVVKHLDEVSKGRTIVCRMQLFFKVDISNKIWLMMCNSLRIDKSALRVDRSIAAINGAASSSSSTGVYGSGSNPSSAKKLKRQPTVKVPPWQQVEDITVPEDATPFTCVITGEACDGCQRCDVSYKLLIQDWLIQASLTTQETDRLIGLDSIPTSIRRHNPNITREYYLKMRSQPAFLLRTAPVCAAAAGALTAAILKELSKTVRRPGSSLADSASNNQLSAVSLQDALNAHAKQQQKQLQQRGIVKPNEDYARARDVASRLSGRDVLYEPGAVIPASLMPKSAPLRRTASPAWPGSARGTSRAYTSNTNIDPSIGRPRTCPTGSRTESGDNISTDGKGVVAQFIPPSVLLAYSSPIDQVSNMQQQLQQMTSPKAACSHSRSPSRCTSPTAHGRTSAEYDSNNTRQNAHLTHNAAEFYGTTRFGPKQSHAMVPSRAQVRQGGSSVKNSMLDMAATGSKQQQQSVNSTQFSSAMVSPSKAVSSSPLKAPLMHNDDLQTLTHLSRAYVEAEAVTQQLLAEARDILDSNSISQLQTPQLQSQAAAASKAPSSNGQVLPRLQSKGSRDQSQSFGGRASHSGGGQAAQKVNGSEDRNVGNAAAIAKPLSTRNSRNDTAGGQQQHSSSGAAPTTLSQPTMLTPSSHSESLQRRNIVNQAEGGGSDSPYYANASLKLRQSLRSKPVSSSKQSSGKPGPAAEAHRVSSSSGSKALPTKLSCGKPGALNVMQGPESGSGVGNPFAPKMGGITTSIKPATGIPSNRGVRESGGGDGGITQGGSVVESQAAVGLTSDEAALLSEALVES